VTTGDYVPVSAFAPWHAESARPGHARGGGGGVTWLLAFGFDACVLALWFALDRAERRGRLERLAARLSGLQQSCCAAWYLTDGVMTQAAQVGELDFMARQGYAQNANGEFEWVGEEEL